MLINRVCMNGSASGTDHLNHVDSSIQYIHDEYIEVTIDFHTRNRISIRLFI